MEKEKFDQKEYVKQWTKSNMKTVSVSYKTEFVTEFREACEKLGIKQSAVFREAMEQFLRNQRRTRAYKLWSFLRQLIIFSGSVLGMFNSSALRKISVSFASGCLLIQSYITFKSSSCATKLRTPSTNSLLSEIVFLGSRYCLLSFAFLDN